MRRSRTTLDPPSDKPAARRDSLHIAFDDDLLAERQLLLDRERRFLDIAAAINSSEDLDRVLRLVRDAVVESGMFERAGVWILEDGRFKGSWGTDAEGGPRDERGCVQDVDEWGAGIQAIMSGEQAYVVKPCLLDEEGEPKIVQPVNHAIVALRASGDLFGIIAVDNLLTHRPVDHSDVQLLLPFADMASAALRSARMAQERQQLLDRQRSFMEIAAAINSSEEPDRVIRLVRDAVVDSGMFDRAGVWIMEGDHFRGAWGTDRFGNVRDEHGYWEEKSDWGPLIPLLLRGERPFVIKTWMPFEEDGPLATELQHAVVSLRAGGELLGVLSVDNLLSRRPIQEEHVRALLPFADMASTALHNAQMTRERSRLMERQRRLMQLAAGMNASLELRQILRMVHDAVIETAGFDRAAVLLCDPGHDTMLGAWGTDRTGQAVDGSGWRMCREENSPNSAFWQVIEGTRPYYHTSNYSAGLGLTEADPMFGVRYHAVVPMKTSGEIVGVICVDNLLTDRAFSEKEIEALAPFAEQAALAIRNARLFHELQEAQEALLRAEKLRALGEMAGGVAHNINNLLTAVLGYAELIRQHPESPDGVKRFAGIIERAGMDGADIVRRIQQFALRDSRTEFEVIDLCAIVHDAADLCQPYIVEKSAKANFAIRLTLQAAEPVHVRGIATEMREVVINLVRNAVDAMPSGGEIVVACRTEGSEAVLEVADDGAGMDEATRMRVFEPFFTTKGPALGLGLGLSMAWGIVMRHGGTIQVDSEPGAGSTFALRIPLADLCGIGNDAAQARSSLAGLRILLVDDEPFVLDSLSSVLTSCGAEVHAAEGGVAALAWLERNPGGCDVVLSDQTMPGITGLELLSVVERLYPSLMRALVSGWGATTEHGAERGAAQAVLPKPIVAENLVSALKELSTALMVK